MERYEQDDFDGEDRAVVRLADGRAAVLPVSARRLDPEALSVYADLMRVGVQVAELEDQIRQLVAAGRDLGVTWALLGAAVGLTGEGARKRYAPE